MSGSQEDDGGFVEFVIAIVALAFFVLVTWACIKVLGIAERVERIDRALTHEESK